ncbi:MAG: hypothetical protein ACQERC_01645 [Bacteroidota bacterium]
MIGTTNFIGHDAVQLAQKQLERHMERGASSRLSIFEVAQLMDVVRKAPPQKKRHNESLFFGFSEN